MNKKLLFIDRDGTLIKEPPETFQVNELDELVLLPGVIRNLYRITTELGFDLVMVSNQDGLGTDAYPEEKFNKVQQKLLEVLEGEGIYFKAIHIDRSFEKENLPTRKPGIAMLKVYLNGDYDIKNSYVIGDRQTDVALAQNLGAKAIFLRNYEHLNFRESYVSLTADTWDDIYRYLKDNQRKITFARNTLETDIHITLNMDGEGRYKVDTGLGFFNHMLEQLAKHSCIDLHLVAKGDLRTDEHHTIEDCGLVLGKAFSRALGNKAGIERYGFCLPMDDCLAQVAIDFGGRPWLVWEAQFNREKIGDMPTEMFYHFFKSFSDGAKCNLNIKAEGTNEHHKIESIFKAFAKATKMAIKKDPKNLALPTTKGIL